MTPSRYRFEAAAIVALCLVPFAASAQDFSVIANQSITADTISRTELRDVFTGESASIHGVKVAPVILSGGLAHEALMRFLGTNAPAFAERRRRARSAMRAGVGRPKASNF